MTMTMGIIEKGDWSNSTSIFLFDGEMSLLYRHITTV